MDLFFYWQERFRAVSLLFKVTDSVNEDYPSLRSVHLSMNYGS